MIKSGAERARIEVFYADLFRENSSGDTQQTKRVSPKTKSGPFSPGTAQIKPVSHVSYCAQIAHFIEFATRQFPSILTIFFW